MKLSSHAPFRYGPDSLVPRQVPLPPVVANQVPDPVAPPACWTNLPVQVTVKSTPPARPEGATRESPDADTVPLPLKVPTEGLVTLNVIARLLATEAALVPFSVPAYVPE